MCMYEPEDLLERPSPLLPFPRSATLTLRGERGGMSDLKASTFVALAFGVVGMMVLVGVVGAIVALISRDRDPSDPGN